MHENLQPNAGKQARNAAGEHEQRQNAPLNAESFIDLMQRERRERVRFCVAGLANPVRCIHKLGRRVELRHYYVQIAFPTLLCHKYNVQCHWYKDTVSNSYCSG